MGTKYRIRSHGRKIEEHTMPAHCIHNEMVEVKISTGIKRFYLSAKEQRYDTYGIKCKHALVTL